MLVVLLISSPRLAREIANVPSLVGRAGNVAMRQLVSELGSQCTPCLHIQYYVKTRPAIQPIALDCLVSQTVMGSSCATSELFHLVNIYIIHAALATVPMCLPCPSLCGCQQIIVRPETRTGGFAIQLTFGHPESDPMVGIYQLCSKKWASVTCDQYVHWYFQIAYVRHLACSGVKNSRFALKAAVKHECMSEPHSNAPGQNADHMKTMLQQPDPLLGWALRQSLCILYKPQRGSGSRKDASDLESRCDGGSKGNDLEGGLALYGCSCAWA